MQVSQRKCDEPLAAAKAKRIRELNDAFRTTFVGGAVIVTASIEALPADLKARLLHRVRTFDDFTEKNDPHGEHDLCAFMVEGTRYYAKIDYYDKDVRYGSDDPADPQITTRILTIMRSDEY
jgi:hypothetical protein